MTRRSRSPRRPRGRGRGRSRASLEWIGGRLSPPFFLTDREEPYRPELVVWMEMPTGLVVGQEVVAPEDVAGAVARALLSALEQPLDGNRRRPDSIRVADESLAAEVRAAAGATTPVVVAPTPELDQLLELLLDSASEQDEDESYLDEGRLTPEAVEKLFAAAKLLYTTAPWEVATDDQILRMDIPTLGVEGACISIVGQLGESLGLLVFPCLAGYEAFLRAAEESPLQDGPVDLGTDWLALNFERGADLPRTMRCEVASHAWPVADAAAYPLVERRDREGASRPLTRRDLKIAAACATSLSAFFTKHRNLFAAEELEPVCESYLDGDGFEVRFTMPYEAFPGFDVDTDPSSRPQPADGQRSLGRQAPPTGQGPTARRGRRKVGRNAPCPCGSGRKYKKCHLPLDDQERTAQSDRDSPRDLDERLVDELVQFASYHLGAAWRRFKMDFVDASQVLQLAVPWAIYHYRIDGASVLDRFLEEEGERLSGPERECLTAQRASWLSVWEVTAVEPGKSLTLCDLLSYETRSVREGSASQTLAARDAVLARVVDFDRESLLCGVYPRSLPPIEAAEVVRRARGRLRRKRAVPVERLLDEAFGRYLIRRWEEAVAELDERPKRPQKLQNTDGDPLLLTTDHFDVAPGKKAEVAVQLAALEGVEPEADDDPRHYVFLRSGNALHKSWENTVIGCARLSESALALETNSRERADALRERVEAACGNRIRRRLREHADPLSDKAGLPELGRPPQAPPPELEQRLLELKQSHYADWIEQALPALGGTTPRKAARTRQGRAAVDLLLKDMENHEQRSASGPAFDFSDIRRQLGLE